MAHPVTRYSAFASVALALTFSSLLRAQDNGGGAPPAAPAAAPDMGAPAPAPDMGAPSGPTSDTATGPVQDTITFQTFYDNLSPMGTWIQTNDYGYVWQPNVTDPNWAPYTLGHWAYTDDGWTWMSDEPFGWATYHYGRWANLQGVGWVWVPGYVWAPAWVSWRTSEDTVGWAPLPPDSMAGVDYSQTDQGQGQTQDQPPTDMGYEIGGDVDEYYGIGPGCYVFLPIGFLCWHDYHGHWCDRHDNWNNINHTHNVTNTRVHRHDPQGRFGRVTVGGPDINSVNAKSQTPIQRLSLTGTKTAGNGSLNGNTLAVYAPHVGAGTATGAKPQQVASTISQVKINRGVDATEPLAVNSHLAPTLPTQEQIAKARQAQSEAPASAKVLTDASTLGTAPRTPFSAMKPIVSHTSAPVFNTQGGQMQGQGQRQFQGQGQGQVFTPQGHSIQQNNSQGAGNAANNGEQRIYQPSPKVYQAPPQGEGRVQQQGQVFTPAPNHSVMQQQSSGGGSSGGGAGASHVYSQQGGQGSSAPVVHQSAPVERQSAPVVRESAPAQSSGGGGGSSGGGEHGSYSAPSSSSSSSGGSSGGSSSGGGGGGGGNGIRGH